MKNILENIHKKHGFWGIYPLIFTLSRYCLLDIGGASGPTLVIKLRLLKHIFTFSTSSLKLLKFGSSYFVRILPESRSLKFVTIMLQFYPQKFWWDFENGKNTNIWCLVTRPLKIFSSKNAEQNS